MFNLKPKHIFNCRFLFSISYATSTDYLDCHLQSFLSTKTPTLKSLLQSHALIITTNNTSNIFIASKLISLYSIFHKPHLATKVFHLIQHKDTFLWNSIIKSNFSNGNFAHTFDLYIAMRLSSTPFNHFTIPMVVSACAELGRVDFGRYVHGLVSKFGLFSENSAVGSCFVYMYAKCGFMDDAYAVFDEITVRDVVAWTALVIGFVQNGKSEKGLECLCEMHRIGGENERPNFRTLEGGFQACGNMGALIEGRCLHGLMVKSGFGCSQFVLSSILSMYSKCGNLGEAYLCFCEVVDKDLFSWTSIIGMYARCGFMKECIRMFWEMQAGEIFPDDIVVSCMLLGFANSMNVYEGKAFHGLMMRRNYVFNHMVQNALLSMYCKFGCITLAEKLFDRVHEKNKESWNTMILGYGRVGPETKCVELFREMQNLGIEFDTNSLVSVISSCSQLGATHLGRSLHCYVVKNPLLQNVSVTNVLIDMYGKSGNLTIAWRILLGTKRDIVTWNTLMSSYSHNGHFTEAIALFEKMISENLKPNLATLAIVISACSHLASIEKGERINHYIKEGGFILNVSLTAALVDMYAKCGQLEKSRILFNSMKERDVVSWNVMISGYGMHGDARSAIEIFEQMEKSNDKPNELTFLALLSACAHAGLVKEGKYLFIRMQHNSVKPNLKHYACMVDLLGRSGNLQEAEALVLSMPISPDGGIWGALLSACRLHNDIEMGVRIAEHAIESDPENDGYHIMLSNLYSSIGRWEEAESAREMMKERGVGKIASWSAVQSK